jgi:adenosylhomocysteine nucleosidase
VLAIIGAMPEEVSLVVSTLTRVTTSEFGRRQFHHGSFHGVDIVAAFSRMGKVAAAATVTQLLAAYPVSEVVFTGVAGGIREDLAIGDVVIGTELVQHDMDASPIFPRYEVPLLGKATFRADPAISERLARASREFLQQDLALQVASAELRFFEIATPRVIAGLIASGDKFFATAAESRQLERDLPAVACVEMEGAAVAQVCDEYGIRFGILRTISDTSDEDSVHDFPRFAREIARHYSAGILRRYLSEL